MNINWKFVNNIPDPIKYAVQGYIRCIETANRVTLPIMIQLLCVLFYFLPEFECIKSANKNFKINADRDTITRIRHQGWDNTIYLNQWIESINNSIISWSFKINRNQHKHLGICFGLVSTQCGLDGPFNSKWFRGQSYYCHYNDSYVVQEGIRSFISHKQSEMFQQDDIVKYTLNLVSGTFKCQINQNKPWIVAKVKQSSAIKYKFVFSMCYEGDSITFIDFSWKIKI